MIRALKRAFRKTLNKHKVGMLRVLFFTSCALCLAVIITTLRVNDGLEVMNAQAGYAIKSVETEEKIYSYTSTLTGKETLQELYMLSNVLEELEVKVTFFVGSEWIGKNVTVFEKLSSGGHIFGLYIDKDFSGDSRNEIMRYIAKENDAFFTVTGKYPKYVRVKNDNSGKINEVLNAYCQYNVSCSFILAQSSKGNIAIGNIVDLDASDPNVPYIALGAISSANKKGLVAVGLNELLYGFESEVDSNGTQKEK